MHIIIKNKKLFIDNYKVKCAIGKRGIGLKKNEGDLITPKGEYKIKYLFYRKDRVKNLNTNIKQYAILKKMGWCDDIRSKDYNKLIRKENTYDIILVLNYNNNPIRKGKGSAIFIHIAKRNYKSTEGCIAMSKNDLKKIIKKINKKTVVHIN